MKRPLILLADDEKRMMKLVSDFLVNAGFNVVSAENGKQALDLFLARGQEIDMLILDVMMPEMDGWEVLKEVKKISDKPVIMLTARTEEADQLTGFRLGANDYVSKPFSPSILVARVENLLKSKGGLGQAVMRIGNISIHLAERSLYMDDKYVELTPKEFDLLVYFSKNETIALSRDHILNAVWNYDYIGDLRTVDTHVKQLRFKLGDYGSYIETVRGIGYRMRCKREDIN
ncbi:response regulator transcription factor [Paenibacillus sp. CMAA1364]